jgi:hypothetical protein
MKLKQFLTVNAIMFIPFGIGMLMVPYLIFPMIHVNLDSDGLLMASTVGSMLLSFGIICYVSRNESLNTIGMKAILTGNLTFHAIDFLLTLKGAYTGVMNALGYMFSTLHFLFALGFLYFLFVRKNNNKH